MTNEEVLRIGIMKKLLLKSERDSSLQEHMMWKENKNLTLTVINEDKRSRKKAVSNLLDKFEYMNEETSTAKRD